MYKKWNERFLFVVLELGNCDRVVRIRCLKLPSAYYLYSFFCRLPIAIFGRTVLFSKTCVTVEEFSSQTCHTEQNLTSASIYQYFCFSGHEGQADHENGILFFAFDGTWRSLQTD